MQTETPTTPAERRRVQQREDTRRAILDATEELLVEDGYDFSIRRLAERCGYTAPTIYHYFGDKRGLTDTLIEERFRLLLERILAVRRGVDPVATLRGQLDAFVQFGLENPTHYRILTSPRPLDSPPPQSAEEARALIELPLAELAAQGRLQITDLETAVQCLWVMLHGLISMRIARPEYEWCDDLENVALDTLLRGLVRPANREAFPAVVRAGGTS